MKEYRREIDGLRAIAVIPVIMVHTQFGLLPGGFSGVDVFFVISGYLITRIILEHVAQGSFRAAEFYARRTRRLVPALVVMLAATAVASWALLMPSDLTGLARATGATAAYGSNVYFYFHTDYFNSGERELLLHTWSLGVEEQFYILFPAIVLFAARWGPSGPVRALAAIGIASFACAIAMTRTEPHAAFYLLPSRIWELAMGGLIAAVPIRPRTDIKVCSALSVAGLACIVLGYRVLTPGEGFPAPGALLPCVGAALILAFGRAGLGHDALSAWPLVLIGRWSYSLYLWHWPIAQFYKIFAGVTLDRFDKVLILGLVLAAGAASYYGIERPVLRRAATTASLGWRHVAMGLGALLVTAGLTAALSVMPPADAATIRDDRYLNYRDTPAFAYQFGWEECFGASIEPRCLVPLSGKPRVLLIGDSYAAQFRRAIAEQYPQVEVLTGAITQCPPLPLAELSPSERCVLAYAPVRNILEGGSIDHVILVARWDRTMMPGLKAALVWLKARGVAATVIGPTVEYDGALPGFLNAARRLKDPGLVDRRRRSEPFAMEREMIALVERHGGRYASQIAVECPRGHCRERTSSDDPYHFDFGHLTLTASRETISRMNLGIPTPR